MGTTEVSQGRSVSVCFIYLLFVTDRLYIPLATSRKVIWGYLSPSCPLRNKKIQENLKDSTFFKSSWVFVEALFTTSDTGHKVRKKVFKRNIKEFFQFEIEDQLFKGQISPSPHFGISPILHKKPLSF